MYVRVVWWRVTHLPKKFEVLRILKNKSFEKPEDGRSTKCHQLILSPFSTMISALLLIEIIISVIHVFSLLSANASNLVQSKSVIRKRVNPFQKKPFSLWFCSTNLLKTLCEKEKLLVTGDFSFPHSVFYPFRHLQNSLPLSSNLKLLYANFFSLKESNICCLGKG